MKTILCFITVLLTFATLALVPNSFAQATNLHNMVRIIYFVPRDRTPQTDMNAKLDKLIKDVQTLFADEMERHGFGRKTFEFEMDRDGNAVIHHVNGRLFDAHYHKDTFAKIETEVKGRFDFGKNVYLIVVDVSTGEIGDFCGRGGDRVNETGDLGGLAMIPAFGHCFDIDITAHELGHAFGLQHDFSNPAYIMSYGAYRDELAPCNTEWFDVNRYFNTRQTPSNSGETMIEMLPPSLAMPPNAILFRFKVTDPEGIHQARLHTKTLTGSAAGFLELVSCKRLNGNPNTTAELVTTYLGKRNKSVSLQVIDVNGNFTMSEEFTVNITSLLPRSKAVSIPDANLAAAIRDVLGLSRSGKITQLDMLELRELSAFNKKITDLSGLEHARNLKYLYLHGNQISDIGVLPKLPNLTVVNLSGNKISDITSITELTNLLGLDLSDNPIDDISPVMKLTQLQTLNLRRCQIQDLMPFVELTDLRNLSLNNNQISDLMPLTGLTQLRNLYLQHNQISDVSPLAGLTQLGTLDLISNQVSDLTVLASLTQLEYLHLSNNQISDVRPLTGLVSLLGLRLRYNPILKASELQTLLENNPYVTIPSPNYPGLIRVVL